MSVLLRELYKEIYGPLDGPGKMKNLAEMAANLSRIANRERPWTNRYLNSLINGNEGFALTEELYRALDAMAGKLDGANPLQAHLVEITAYSINGSVEPGSIITGKSTRCPGCLVLFVPHNYFQVYCGPECPGRPKRKGRKAALSHKGTLPRKGII